MNNCLLCKDQVDLDLNVNENETNNIVLSTLLKLYTKLSKTHGLFHLFQSAKVCSVCVNLLLKIDEYFVEIETIQGKIHLAKETLQNNLIDCRKHSETEDDLRNILYNVISEEEQSTSILDNFKGVKNENDDSISNAEVDETMSDAAEDIELDLDDDGDGNGGEEICAEEFCSTEINDPNLNINRQSFTTNLRNAEGGEAEAGNSKMKKKCPLCPRLIHYTGLYRHIKRVHREKSSTPSTSKPTNVVKKYSCNECIPNKQFATIATYNAHVNAIHLGVKYKCTFANCDRTYSYEWDLRRHLRDYHEHEQEQTNEETKYPSILPSSIKASKVLNPNYSKKRHVCPICESRFSSTRCLRRHIQSLHGENRKKFICLICNPDPNNLTSNGICSNVSSLRRHFVQVHKMKALENIDHLFNTIVVPQNQKEIEAETETESTLDQEDQDQNQDMDDAIESTGAGSLFTNEHRTTKDIILNSLNKIKNELFFDESAAEDHDHFLEDNNQIMEDQEPDPFKNY